LFISVYAVLVITWYGRRRPLPRYNEDAVVLPPLNVPSRLRSHWAWEKSASVCLLERYFFKDKTLFQPHVQSKNRMHHRSSISTHPAVILNLLTPVNYY